MKKLLVLAMVLVLAAPMFADVSIGGEFDYYMVNGFDNDNAASFQDEWDKGEVDFKIGVGDYSQMRIELEEDGEWNKGTGTAPEGKDTACPFSAGRSYKNSKALGRNSDRDAGGAWRNRSCR